MPSAAAATSSAKTDVPDLTDDDSDAEAEVKNVKAYCDAGEEETGENRARELRAEIELLELMLSRGTAGLLDLYVMREEIEDLQASELEGKAGELQEVHWETKRSILELKKKKTRELVRWVARSEVRKLEREGKAIEIVENENEEGGGGDEEFGGNDRKGLKLHWRSILAAIGAGALAAAAAVLLIGRVKVQNPKKFNHRDQPRCSSMNTDISI